MLTNYQSVRPTIQDGDLVLWRGKSIVAKIIQMFQFHNHASLCFNFLKHDIQRVMLYEALSHGVEPEFLSARVERYRGRVWWYPLKKEYESFRADIYWAANSYAGTAYDYKNLFKNLLGYVSLDAEKLFCSEFVAICIKEAGLLHKFEHVAPRPDDLLEYGVWSVEEGLEISTKGAPV